MAIVVAEKGEKVGGYCLNGLASCWDQDFLVRQRLRSGLNLVCKYDPSTGASITGTVEKSADNCKINNFILSPILCMMFQNDFKLPAIDEVQTHVADIYQLNQCTVTEVQIYQDSWAIRRLLHYMKSMLYRPTFPKDVKGHFCICVSGCGIPWYSQGSFCLKFRFLANTGVFLASPTTLSEMITKKASPSQFAQMIGICSKLNFSEQQLYTICFSNM